MRFCVRVKLLRIEELVVASLLPKQWMQQLFEVSRVSALWNGSLAFNIVTWDNGTWKQFFSHRRLETASIPNEWMLSRYTRPRVAGCLIKALRIAVAEYFPNRMARRWRLFCGQVMDSFTCCCALLVSFEMDSFMRSRRAPRRIICHLYPLYRFNPQICRVRA